MRSPKPPVAGEVAKPPVGFGFAVCQVGAGTRGDLERFCPLCAAACGGTGGFGGALQLLSDIGFTTTWAENGVEALRLIKGEGKEFDAVFSDVVMSGAMSGLDLANKLRRLRPTLPVIMATGYSEVLAEGQGSNFELLRKPCSAESLSRLQREAMSVRSNRLAQSF